MKKLRVYVYAYKSMYVTEKECQPCVWAVGVGKLGREGKKETEEEISVVQCIAATRAEMITIAWCIRGRGTPWLQQSPHGGGLLRTGWQ